MTEMLQCPQINSFHSRADGWNSESPDISGKVLDACNYCFWGEAEELFLSKEVRDP